MRFSYKHCIGNFSRDCLLVKMAPKTVTRSILEEDGNLPLFFLYSKNNQSVKFADKTITQVLFQRNVLGFGAQYSLSILQFHQFLTLMGVIPRGRSISPKPLSS